MCSHIEEKNYITIDIWYVPSYERSFFCLNFNILCEDNDKFKIISEINNCSSEQFSCHGKTEDCIALNWICDGNPDCSDASDESECSKNLLYRLLQKNACQ